MSDYSADLTDEEEKHDLEIENQELQSLVEKLHKFAKWQQENLAKQVGFQNEFFSKQLKQMMNKSIKVILKQHDIVVEEELNSARSASAAEALSGGNGASGSQVKGSAAANSGAANDSSAAADLSNAIDQAVDSTIDSVAE